jgi:hypothetical protein
MNVNATRDAIVALWRNGDEYRAAAMIDDLYAAGEPEKAAAAARATLAIREIEAERPEGEYARERLDDYLAAANRARRRSVKAKKKLEAIAARESQEAPTAASLVAFILFVVGFALVVTTIAVVIVRSLP